MKNEDVVTLKKNEWVLIWLLLLPFAFFAAMPAGKADADVATNVSRIFELHTKLAPGMTIEALNELLGPPADSTPLGKGDVTRYAWLHGEMGIEAYEVEDAVYRVTITTPCGDNKSLLRVIDGITRQGRAKYGSMPSSDYRKNEYYWVRDGLRFAFSKYNKTTVFSSCTKAR